jgi:hypothetical protein
LFGFSDLSHESPLRDAAVVTHSHSQVGVSTHGIPPIAALIVLSAGTASAAPFGYQQQIESSELDPNVWEGPALMAQALADAGPSTSGLALYESTNYDGVTDFAYVGDTVPSISSDVSGYDRFRKDQVTSGS